MSKKEKVQFSHGETFESVEDLLTEAIESLDQANERIQRLLQSETRGPEDTSSPAPAGEAETAENSAAPEAPEQP
jgi:hypothetical protein